MTAFTLPPNTRAVGDGNPPADIDALVNILGLVLGIAVDGTGTVTSGALELTPNQVTISGASGATSSPLSVVGSSDAGQLVYIEQDSSTDHALTVNLVGTGGATQAALNAVSANSAFSAAEISGTETAHGTLKITHHGYSAASDSGAAGLSIDLQTTVGGSTGTAAQGIFITSTTDTLPPGNALTVRYNSQDWFVVKGGVGTTGAGIVGIGVATGHTPAGMLEIAQKDTSTFGLAMTAIASGTDMINLKDSGGNQRFQVNNSGNMITRATAYISTTVQIGSTSASLGGGGNGCVGITNASTNPSTTPTGGGILYASAGALFWKGSSGGAATQIASA